MRQSAARIVLLPVAAFLLGAAPPEVPPQDGKETAARFAKVHPDVPALERAVVEATLAYIRSDLQAARAALEGVEAGCRRLAREEVSTKPLEDVMLYDQVFHKTVDLAREFAAADKYEKSFDQFVWAQKACRICHGLAVKAEIRAEPPPRPK